MDDIFMEHHNQRTKSTMSEAFKDDVYASPITKFHNVWYHMFRYLEMVIAPVTIGVVVGFILATLLFVRG